MLKTDDKRERILFVGEGNFSFSRTFFRKFRALGHKNKYQMVSTSFDSIGKVFEKYPESPPILNEMNRHLELRHDINSIYLSSYFPASSFQHVFFNFPHLGYEDINKHQSFLAHFLNSCHDILSEDGIVYVALAATQEVGWKLTETAIRLGYHPAGSLPIIDCEWIGYDFRRHQSGKSFKQRVGACYHYCYRKSSTTAASSVSNVLRVLLLSSQPSIIAKPPLAAVQEEPSSQSALQPVLQQDSNNTTQPKQQQQKKKKRRRVQELTDNRFHEAVTTNSNTKEDGSSNNSNSLVVRSYVCNDCSRSFASDLSIRTHIYTVHILSRSQSTSTEGELVEYVCEHCEHRKFPNQEALHQHCIAKHRQQQPAAATEKEKETQETEAIAVAEILCPCPICSWPITNMKDHLDMFSPRDKECTMPCPHCQRCFADERSLSQHAAFCALATGATCGSCKDDSI